MRLTFLVPQVISDKANFFLGVFIVICLAVSKTVIFFSTFAFIQNKTKTGGFVIKSKKCNFSFRFPLELQNSMLTSET